jgi:hypothetical protein
MEALDIRDTLTAKSDQLNADDLVGGEITVQVTGVSRGSAEQPLIVRISDGYQPWKPCKTMRRVLGLAWGADDANLWIGKWLVLYRDPTVRFGSDTVGGVRLKAMSDIPKAIEVNLAASKGKKAPHRIAVYTPPRSDAPMSEADFLKWLGHATSKGGWTRDQVKPILVAHGSTDPTKIAPEKRAAVVAIVSKPPAPVEDEPGDGGPPPGAGVEGWE